MNCTAASGPKPAIALFLLLAAAGPARAADVSVTDPWIAAGPPVVRVNAGYLRIANAGADTAILAGATSPRFARIEIHRSETRDGRVSMQREEAVAIPAGDSVSFTPGALHLMLFDAASPPVLGETIPLTLRFADGTAIDVEAMVRTPVAAESSHHEHRH